jgi:signal transduction histidine kinase
VRSTSAPIDVEKALGDAVVDLLGTVRGDSGRQGGAEALARTLAGHALSETVRGAAVVAFEGTEDVRLVAAAGATGSVIAGSVWPLADSPVAEVLAGTRGITDVEPAHSPLGRALAPGEGDRLLALPLRVGDRGGGDATSLGALLLVVDGAEPMDGSRQAYLEDLSTLVAMTMLVATPAQDWLARARRLRGDVDAAVEVAGSLDARQIVDSVLSRACATSGASRASLLRIRGDDVVTEGVHDADGFPAALEWRHPLADQPLLARAAATGQPVLGGNLDLDGLPPGLPPAFADVRQTMVLPLHLGDSVQGLLVVFRRQARPFIHDDATTLQLLGNLALLALRNSQVYEDARAASGAMASFLSLIAHDLRAPLTVLGGYLDLLLDGTFGDPPPSWEKPLRTINAKLSETQRLVDDIMLASRLENGVVPCTTTTLDLNEVVKGAAERVEGRAALAGATVETSPSQAPVRVRADAFHVDRVVDNLVNNAINYGGGSPWIRLAVDASGGPPAITVEDHGIGIAPELHGRIFERFFRVENHVPGTGFGLHVGRLLAEACGGSLRLQRSVPGAGSTFRLELPAAQPEAT